MEVTGPAIILLRDGYPVRLYEVVTKRKTPKGTSATHYYFKDSADAETYYNYLLQVAGIEQLDRTINNKRTFEWEREELIEFRKTLDLSILENEVKGIKFEENTIFYPAVGKQKRIYAPKPPIDTEERVKWHKKFQNYQI